MSPEHPHVNVRSISVTVVKSELAPLKSPVTINTHD